MAETPPTGAEPDERPTVISEDRAKQGRRGVPIVVVLVVGAVLAALAMGVVYLFNQPALQSVEPHNARQATDAEAFDRPSGDYARQSPPGEQPPADPSLADEPAPAAGETP